MTEHQVRETLLAVAVVLEGLQAVVIITLAL